MYNVCSIENKKKDAIFTQTLKSIFLTTKTGWLLIIKDDNIFYGYLDNVFSSNVWQAEDLPCFSSIIFVILFYFKMFRKFGFRKMAYIPI